MMITSRLKVTNGFYLIFNISQDNKSAGRGAPPWLSLLKIERPKTWRNKKILIWQGECSYKGIYQIQGELGTWSSLRSTFHPPSLVLYMSKWTKENLSCRGNVFKMHPSPPALEIILFWGLVIIFLPTSMLSSLDNTTKTASSSLTGLYCTKNWQLALTGLFRNDLFMLHLSVYMMFTKTPW